MEFVNFAHDLFHSHDIRINASELSDEMAMRLYHAEAWYIKECIGTNKIILCRDTRNKCAHLLQMGIDLFLELGFQVYTNVLPVSTCQFYFSCMKMTDCAGIVCTASHNPKEYIGHKIVAPGVAPIAEEIGPSGGLSAIRTAFLEGKKINPEQNSKSPKTRGKLTVINDADEYVKYFLNFVDVQKDDFKNISVAVDFMSGCAGDEIMQAFNYAGVSCVARNVVPDGDFPNGDPNPIVEKNIADTVAYIKECDKKFDFCFFFDGDGDRIDIRDGNLHSISPSVIMAFIAKNLSTLLMAENKNLCAGIDAKATPIVYEALREKGIEPFLIPNGHSRIKNILRDGKVFAAVEESAHYYMYFPFDKKFFPIESTLLICLLFLKCWKNDKTAFEELCKKQSSIMQEREWAITYAKEKDRDDALSAVENFFLDCGFTATKNTSDGSSLDSTLLRKEFPDGKWCWISQRASQSEKNVARWMVSSSNKCEVKNAVDNIKKLTK